MISTPICLSGCSSAFDYKEAVTAAGVLLGFQVTFLHWRISREADLGDKKKISIDGNPVREYIIDGKLVKSERKNYVSFAPADYLGLTNLLVVGVGLFVLPLFVSRFAIHAHFTFASGVILLLGHVFSLGVHYSLFGRPNPRPEVYDSTWEWLVTCFFWIVASIILLSPALFEDCK